MLSLSALERASQSYRRGYQMGARGETFNDCTNAEKGTFAAKDYSDGYEAGVCDAKPMRERQRAATECASGDSDCRFPQCKCPLKARA